jgi:hypothetical protein
MTPGAPAHSAGRLGLHGVMSMPSGTKETPSLVARADELQMDHHARLRDCCHARAPTLA